jgi:acyl-CoA dehydrogenase
MILVPLDNPGYKLIRNIPIMGDVGVRLLESW